MLARIRSSLALRLALLVAGLCFAVFVVLAWMGNASQRDNMLHQLAESMDDEAELLYLSIEKPMIVGDDASTRKEFATLGRKFTETSLYLTDFTGNITYSTTSSDVRRDFAQAVNVPAIQAMLQKGLAQPIREGSLVQTDGRSLFVEVFSVENQPSCHHCHGASEPILGCMVIMKNVDPAMAAIANQTFNSALYSLAGGVLLVGTLLAFLRRVVLRPITRLAAASDAVAAGNYASHFILPGSDELAALSRNLEAMLQEIKTRLGFAQGVLKGVTYPCVLVDPDNTILYCNQELLSLFQKRGRPEDYLQTNASVFFYDDASRDTTALLAVRQNQRQARELTFRLPSGELTVNISATPITDLDGKPLGGFALYFDLTAIRAQEARIASQNVQMQEIAAQARIIMDRLVASSEELASQVEETAQGAHDQHQRTRQTAAAMEEMNATVLEVAGSASNAAQLTEDMRQEAGQGEAVVDETVAAIGSVAQETQSLQRAMEELDKQAEGIGAIMQVIQDIADQTNLLALNAAIEAARAGDAGRGFAVVADEVRKLAEKTMTATKDVAQSVSSIQAGVRKNSQAVHVAASSVDKATNQARHSRDALERIVTLAGQASDQVRSIAAASEQQSAASEEITRAVEAIHGIANENSLAMAEASKALNILAGLASELETLVQQLNT
ncbi:methyl-accepting chemotaxis protein [Megalodesulfovibrio gigas]|uniref:Putative methyl-accepting chemotaxis sensory transducer protein n=1 Tax=Megalodesulfovibrio gigas (strain ATCC 19364 / DSM 1382 / NCIMB 9332 / VKM B-1759) TaxID=1121448 RepID=T2G833_MEGG1|nr:methyl-accepting chemotaxis protein [Megalodesulfovibrio gigas]AGW12301.1 putative methyl-accepting chemotaxis sensory transducer protein [Megalodesulfovibrio gigas DSM 1382 = ATCC 19364]